jgi:hypothetical protein
VVVFEGKEKVMELKLGNIAVVAVFSLSVLSGCPSTSDCKTRADCGIGEVCSEAKKCVAGGTGGGTPTGGGGGGPVGGGGGGGGPVGGGGGGGGQPMGMTIEVTKDITANTTWSKGNTYILKQLTYIENATLTIEPGVKVLGDKGSALISTTTGKLVAEGTAAEPIVMSSNFPAGMRGLGKNWGGVVMLGKAAINVPNGTNLAEGVKDEPRNYYGGGATPDNKHNCGTLKYVRIEFAGETLDPNNELNGLGLYACGSDTVIDYVQVHRGIDDAVEMFGGSVNLKHLVLTGNDDDAIDWDQGWTGKVQFVAISQYAGFGNYGIEADNNRMNNDFMPRSNPTVYNVTLVGRKPDTANGGEGTSRGIVFKVGTAGKLSNLIVMDFTDWSMFVDGPVSAQLWNSGDLKVQNSVFFNNGTNVFSQVESSKVSGAVPMPDLNEGEALQVAALSNRNVDPMLEDPTNVKKPNWKPKAGSPVLTGGATPPDDPFFDKTATFVGAIGTTDWTAGWTAYPEN